MYGHLFYCTGPLAHRAGHDINYMAISGVLSVSCWPLVALKPCNTVALIRLVLLSNLHLLVGLGLMFCLLLYTLWYCRSLAAEENHQFLLLT